MRNMVFSYMADQVRAHQKWVTRRLGRKFLKPGDRFQAVRKARGLKKGEGLEKLAVCIVVHVTPEALDALTNDHLKRWAKREMNLEGLPGVAPAVFVNWFCREMKCTPETIVTRIRFAYTEPWVARKERNHEGC